MKEMGSGQLKGSLWNSGYLSTDSDIFSYFNKQYHHAGGLRVSYQS